MPETFAWETLKTYLTGMVDPLYLNVVAQLFFQTFQCEQSILFRTDEFIWFRFSSGLVED